MQMTFLPLVLVRLILAPRVAPRLLRQGLVASEADHHRRVLAMRPRLHLQARIRQADLPRRPALRPHHRMA